MYILHFAYPFLYWWTLASMSSSGLACHMFLVNKFSILWLMVKVSLLFSSLLCYLLKLLHWLYVARISHSVKILSAPPPLHFVGLHYSLSCNTDFHVFPPILSDDTGSSSGQGLDFTVRSPRRYLGLRWWVSLGCFSCFMSHLGLLQLN